MKMIKAFIVLSTLLLLIGCDTTTNVDNPPQCVTGYEAVDGKCVKLLTVDDCLVGEKVENNVCVDDPDYDPNETNLPGPAYQSQNYPEYTGRDIVNPDCDYLDNIGEWQPVWCDEFDYQGLPDSTKWNYDVGGSGWGNNELQYYTNADTDNAYVANGYLTIEAKKEVLNGRDYTSARLVTRDKGDFLYGKIQVRAKVPGGKGTWPAIWMLSTDWNYGGWPDSGEIDIMEYVGVDPNLLHATIHTKAFNHSINTQIGKSITLQNMETEFHVYEIEWEPNVIRFYVNGVNYYTVEYNPDESSHVEPFEAWPFDQDFHLLINLAFGGNWGGYAGIDETLDNMKYEIDYVRVYQKDYAGMDTSAPEAVTDLRIVSDYVSEALVAWDSAVDDVMVEYYEVYINDELFDTSTHNAITIAKDTSAKTIKVIPVDFAGNKGPEQVITVSEMITPTQNDRIQAEAYINMSGIQTESTSDAGGGLNIGYVDSGDYLEYTVEITQAGTYQIKARTASQSNGGTFDFLQNGTKIADCTFSATGGWQNWQDSYSSSFYLDTGTYTFRIQATSDSWNLNYFDFVLTD